MNLTYFFRFILFLQNVLKFQFFRFQASTYTLWTVNDVLEKDPLERSRAEGPYNFLGKLPKLAVFPAKSGAENIASLGIVHQKRPLGVFPRGLSLGHD